MTERESLFPDVSLIQVFVVEEDGSVTVGDSQEAEDD